MNPGLLNWVLSREKQSHKSSTRDGTTKQSIKKAASNNRVSIYHPFSSIFHLVRLAHDKPVETALMVASATIYVLILSEFLRSRGVRSQQIDADSVGELSAFDDMESAHYSNASLVLPNDGLMTGTGFQHHQPTTFGKLVDSHAAENQFQSVSKDLDSDKAKEEIAKVKAEAVKITKSRISDASKKVRQLKASQTIQNMSLDELLDKLDDYIALWKILATAFWDFPKNEKPDHLARKYARELIDLIAARIEPSISDWKQSFIIDRDDASFLKAIEIYSVLARKT